MRNTTWKPWERATLLVKALLIPVAGLFFWQWAGSRPDMAGIVPTPWKVLQGWHDWIFASPGMGLNPYLGTWLANVQYSSMRVSQGFALASVIGVPIGLLIGWSRLSKWQRCRKRRASKYNQKGV